MSDRGRPRIRRTLTRTPLARAHDRVLLRRGSRRHAPIAFGQFDRAKYPAPALALALEAQRALALGEYGAIDLFAQLASGLARMGAPFDLIAEATRVPGDEIRHADLTFQMAAALAGEDVEIDSARIGLGRRANPALDLEGVDHVMVQIAAISETLSCALLDACRERARDRVVRAVFRTIVADEVHHARLGWYYLAWRAPQWSRAERQRVADRAGEVVIDVERRFWHGRDAAPGAEDAARALGVLESEGQRRAVRAVMDDEIVPALDALGLGASHAWRMRRPGPGR